jgi:glutaconate CoA-transferase subunit B
MSNFTNMELMVTCAARGLKDGNKVLVGIGLPYVAAVLAKLTHAPNLCMLMELGCFGSSPIDTGVGAADPRSWYNATRFSSLIETLGMIAHRGRLDVGLLGALEVDEFGNVNSTQLNIGGGRIRHINGSGGGNDTASLAKMTIVIARHEKRKLKKRVDYNTSPGHLQGGTTRSEAGLKGGGIGLLITDKAVLVPDEVTKRLKLQSIHPGITPEEVINETGFEIDVTGVPETPAPTMEEVRLIREVIDPTGIYTGRKHA